jgi:hypothetical protein
MYGLPFLVHCAVEILTRLPDLDVGLVDTVRRAAHLQVLTYSLIDLRAITLDPTKDSRVIHVESALTHHLFDISIRKLVSAIPPDAQKYYGRLEVTPLERGLVLHQEYDSRGITTELKVGL